MKVFFFTCVFIGFLCLLPAKAASNIDSQSLNKLISLKPEQAFVEIQLKLNKPSITLQRKAELKVLLAEVAYYIDQPEHILQYSTQALSSGLLNNKWHAKALINQARAYFQRKQYEKFYIAANSAVKHAEEFNLPKQRVAALIERAFSYAFLDKHILAENDVALVSRYFKVLPDDFNKAVLLDRFSGVNQRLTRNQAALTAQQKAIIIYQKMKATHFTSIAYYNFAGIYKSLNNWRQAAINMQLSYDWAVKDNNKLNQAFSLYRLAEYKLRLGEKVAAESHLIEAMKIADQTSSERVKALVRKDMAQFLCDENKILACEKLIVETLGFTQQHGLVTDEIELKRMLAQVYFQQGHFEKAYLLLKETL